MNKPEYDSKDDMHVIDGKPYETQAISRVKDFVCDEITQQAEFTPGEGYVSNGIDLADHIVTSLLNAGVLIPSDLTQTSIARSNQTKVEVI